MRDIMAEDIMKDIMAVGLYSNQDTMVAGLYNNNLIMVAFLAKVYKLAVDILFYHKVMDNNL